MIVRYRATSKEDMVMTDEYYQSANDIWVNLSVRNYDDFSITIGQGTVVRTMTYDNIVGEIRIQYDDTGPLGFKCEKEGLINDKELMYQIRGTLTRILDDNYVDKDEVQTLRRMVNNVEKKAGYNFARGICPERSL